MTVLITGGAGYMGSALAMQLLESGHQVRIVDNLMHGTRSLAGMLGRDCLDFQRGDLLDAATRDKAVAGVDSVVHLAAIVGDPACARDPQLARDVNCDASFGLLEASKSAGVRRFVFASTCSNYGKMADISVPATEDHELKPLSLYAETKVAVEQRLLGNDHGGLAATSLRFATLYGLAPRMRFDLTVNEFVMRMLVEQKLRVFGEQFWRPYVHVRDAARAIGKVLSAPAEQVAGQVFNVGDTSENYRKVDLVEMIDREVPGADISYVAVAQDPRDYRVSFKRISERLGFTVSRRVPDGIREIATAIRSGMLDELDHSSRYNTPV